MLNFLSEKDTLFISQHFINPFQKGMQSVKKIIAYLLTVLILCTLFALPAAAQGEIGSVEMPLESSDFWQRYPYYTPITGDVYASTAYMDGWVMGKLLMSAGGESLLTPGSVALYTEASYASTLMFYVPQNVTLYLLGVYDGIYYDGNDMTWGLVYYYERDRYGWVCLNDLYLNAPSEPETGSGEVLWGYATQRISTRSGPGTTYSEMGTYNNVKDTWVQIRSRAWDARNEIWWVEVLIGDQWLWTGYKRIDPESLPLESIPISSEYSGSGSSSNNSSGNSSYTPPSSSAAIYGYATQRISTRSGPGTTYSEMGTYNHVKNTWVQVRARAWDARNEIWWVEVLIGDQWLWTGYKRFDPESLPLESLPVKQF